MLNNVSIRAVAVFISTVAIGLGSTRPGVAQTSASPPEAVKSALRVGRSVWVTTIDGQEVRGEIASVSDDEIGLRDGRNIAPIKWRDVRVIETKDSLTNGLVLGAIVGGGLGALGGFGTVQALGCDDDCAQFVGGSVLAGLMFAVPVALLIDYAHKGRRPIYQQPTRVSIAPLLLPGRAGFSAALRW